LKNFLRREQFAPPLSIQGNFLLREVTAPPPPLREVRRAEAHWRIRPPPPGQAVFALFCRLEQAKSGKRKTTGNLLVASGFCPCRMVGLIELFHNPEFRIRDTLFEFPNPDYRNRIRKSKMTFGKFPSGTGFQVLFEGSGFFL
ncbi:MAG: hypothetical protein IJJ28_00475, partial [Lentisphaeria bacterium]|nr:hypothetical protein [Lentisphaeria bacterium]